MGNGLSWIWGYGFQGALFGNRYAVLDSSGVGTPKRVFGVVQTGCHLWSHSDPGAGPP